MVITIKDVAKEAGVAISTVSNVLNNSKNVSEETRKKVDDAVEKLKYVPNINAKLLKTNKKNTIGLFLPSVQGDFYRILIQEIHMKCKHNGYLLNIYISNENTSEEIYGMIASSGVEGAIVLNERLDIEYAERLAGTKLPIVFIDRAIEGDNISSVIVNNEEGSIMGMEYLIKQGNRRIGYIHGVDNFDNKGRYQAYLDVMNKYDLPIDEDIILKGYFEDAVAYSEMRILLLKGIELPDAIFCANDEMAMGCIRALNDARIKVPEEVSVLGYDDIATAAFHKPPLTTIHSPVPELGIMSSNELLRLIKEEDGERQGTIIHLMPSLVIRDTCKFKI